MSICQESSLWVFENESAATTAKKIMKTMKKIMYAVFVLNMELVNAAKMKRQSQQTGTPNVACRKFSEI